MNYNMNLSWKDVFDTSKKHWGHISIVVDFIEETGYEYFSWNGRIYDTYGNDTNLLTENLKSSV
tara:strand:- start:351 stop:542 length:192 start_codon:yes stop_codon:yes gene_type:complete